jgi:hypothetical protein
MLFLVVIRGCKLEGEATYPLSGFPLCIEYNSIDVNIKFGHRYHRWMQIPLRKKTSLDAIPVQKQFARPRVLSWLRREVLGRGVEVAQPPLQR